MRNDIWWSTLPQHCHCLCVPSISCDHWQPPASTLDWGQEESLCTARRTPPHCCTLSCRLLHSGILFTITPIPAYHKHTPLNTNYNEHNKYIIMKTWPFRHKETMIFGLVVMSLVRAEVCLLWCSDCTLECHYYPPPRFLYLSTSPPPARPPPASQHISGFTFSGTFFIVPGPFRMSGGTFSMRLFYINCNIPKPF